MKLRIYIGFLMATCLWGQAAADTPGRVGRLSFVYGSVSYRPDAVEEWAPAALNAPLTSGDHLWTDKDSQAEVYVGLTAVHLAPETGFFLQTLDDRVFRMTLAEGALNLRIPRMNEGEIVEIETEYGLFRLLATGSYRVDVQPEGGYAAVIVRAGAAEAVVNGETHAVPAGKRLVLAGKPATIDLMDAPPLDPWDKWCADRDEQTERGYDRSSQYVSWEIPGAADFADYGTWESDPDYGWCWIPRVLPSGWMPYRFGFWIWKNPWGWTWVDREPWGFATHHFGRWIRHSRRGLWVWRPDNDRFHPRFSPAHVEFSRSNGRISWAPIGHRDAATTLDERDFISARDANRSRLIVVERTPIEFTGRKLAVAPTRESMLGGRPSGGPTQRRNPEPVSQPQIGAATVRERLPVTQTPPPPDRIGDRDAARRQRESEEARQTLERRRRDAEEDDRRREAVETQQRREEEGRRQAEGRRAEENRRQADARRQEEGRRAEEHRRQTEEQRRQADDARRQEEGRRAEEHRRQAEETRRQADEARRQEEGRRAEEHRRQAEEQRRQADESRRQEEGRRAEEHRRQAEEQRRRADEEQRRQVEETRRQADEARRQEEGRRAEEHRRQAEEQRRQADEARRQEEGRRAEEQRRQDEEARAHQGRKK